MKKVRQQQTKAQIDTMIGLSQKLSTAVSQDLVDLLHDFGKFSSDYHSFIAKNGSEQIQDFVYDLHQAVERIQVEWATISRACEQQLIQPFKEELTTIDVRIQQYYNAFLGYKISSKPVAYFEKLYAITRFVFTPFPMISVPLRYFGSEKKYASLAHEMGHYFYWNSCGPQRDNYAKVHLDLQNLVGATLVQHLQERNTDDLRNFLVLTWVRWLEETFADVCATLLEGVIFCDSAITRAWEETGLKPYRLLADDGEHPAHYLRPLIALETLAWIAEHESDADNKAELINTVADFRSRWEEDLSEVGFSEVDLKDIFDNDTLPDDPIGELQKSVRPVVWAILGQGNGQKSWVEPDLSQKIAPYEFMAQAANLGALFHYPIWFNSAGLKGRPTPEQKFVRPVSDSEYSFDNLLKLVEQSPSAQEEGVVKALLELSLSEEDFDTPRRRRTREDGPSCNGKVTYVPNSLGEPRCVRESGCTKPNNGQVLYILSNACG